MKAVYLEWVDSMVVGTAAWVPLDANFGQSCCKTLGFVIREDKHTITVAGHLSTDERDCSGNMTIPKCAVTKRRRVQYG